MYAFDTDVFIRNLHIVFFCDLSLHSTRSVDTAPLKTIQMPG